MIPIIVAVDPLNTLLTVSLSKPSIRAEKAIFKL
jgi:hypothetical protein